MVTVPTLLGKNKQMLKCWDSPWSENPTSRLGGRGQCLDAEGWQEMWSCGDVAGLLAKAGRGLLVPRAPPALVPQEAAAISAPKQTDHRMSPEPRKESLAFLYSPFVVSSLCSWLQITQVQYLFLPPFFLRAHDSLLSQQGSLPLPCSQSATPVTEWDETGRSRAACHCRLLCQSPIQWSSVSLSVHHTNFLFLFVFHLTVMELAAPTAACCQCKMSAQVP